MPDRIIKPPERIYENVRDLFFGYKGHETSWGLGFECDHHGKVHEPTLTPVALQNYKDCLKGAVCGQSVAPGIVRMMQCSRVELGEIKCDCGKTLFFSFGEDSTCDKCNREYNSSGQLLAPRSQWGEETGETFASPNWSNDQ